MRPNPDTSWTMIAAAAAGDALARTGFHSTYMPIARAFLHDRWRGRVLTNEVDDALQEVFLECFRNKGALTRAKKDHGGFRGYFLGTVRNVAARYERRASRSRLRSEQDEITFTETPADATRVSIAFDRAFARSVMQEATRLQAERASDDPEAQRRIEILKARIVDGRPIRAIANDLGADHKQTHRAYARARREYYACLRDVVARHCGTKNIEAECQWLLDILGQ